MILPNTTMTSCYTIRTSKQAHQASKAFLRSAWGKTIIEAIHCSTLQHQPLNTILPTLVILTTNSTSFLTIFNSNSNSNSTYQTAATFLIQPYLENQTLLQYFRHNFQIILQLHCISIQTVNNRQPITVTTIINYLIMSMKSHRSFQLPAL